MRPLSVAIVVVIATLTVIGVVKAKRPQPSASQANASPCDGIVAGSDITGKCHKSGERFIECAECPEMVVVPAGSFDMGSEDNSGDETPVHRVSLAEPIAIGRYEISFEQWDACVVDGGCHHRPNDQGWGRGSRPVLDVSWNDVTATYLPWLSRKSGHTYRLLTEAEWEYAARAGSPSVYSWGDQVGKGAANCDGCGSEWDNRQTAPIGSFPPNAFGLHDMHGNVWEWTQDCYEDNYGKAAPDGSAATKPDCQTYVVRGGGWNDRPKYLRSAIRYGDPPAYRSFYVGFRVARSAHLNQPVPPPQNN